MIRPVEVIESHVRALPGIKLIKFEFFSTLSFNLFSMNELGIGSETDEEDFITPFRYDLSLYG
jgi:hypothetical protein